MAFKAKKEKQELSPQEKALRAKEFVNMYARYSGIAFQMIVLIGGGAYLGYYLDGKNGTNPMWTVICSLAGVGMSLFTLYKSLRELERFNKHIEAQRKALREQENKDRI